MNKLAFPIALLALIANVASFFVSNPSQALVYVDVNKLIEGYSLTALEKEAFNKKTQVLKANVDSLVANSIRLPKVLYP
ncbi:hypothetical protein [Maribacter sp. 2-571]|uniref:hypothetical protein n=1 Tax=Maribacter sp. 2-571 TaxID=3417569 RepID=UPI003D330CA7